MITKQMAGFLAMSTGMLRRLAAAWPLRVKEAPRDIAVIGADVQLAVEKRERKNVKRACAWTGAHD